MAEVELIIKIPEEIYQHYKKVWQKRIGSIPESCIAFGIPLPKGHGRLKDVDWIDDNCENHHSDRDGSWCYTWRDIDDAPTIIEADKESRE